MKQHTFLARLPGSVKFDDPEHQAQAVATMLTKAAEAIDKADKVSKEAESVIASNRVATEEIKSLRETVQKGTFDQTNLEESVVKVIEKHTSEMVARGGLSDSEQAAVRRVTDPWDEKADYLAWQMKRGEEADHRKVLNAAIVSAPRSETHKHFQRMSIDMQIFGGLATLASQTQHASRISPHELMAQELPNICAKWLEYQRAMLAEFGIKAAIDPIDTATAGSAGNWIPTPMATEVREMIMLEARLATIFPRAIVRVPGKQWDIPVDLTDVFPDLIPETTAYTNPYAATDPTQLGQTLNAAKKSIAFAKHRARFMYSGEFSEDAIIEAAAFLRAKLVKTLSNGEERVIVNGQKTANIDTVGGGPGTYDIRKASDGLRYFASAGVANVLHNAGSDNLVYSDLTAVRALMGVYGMVPEDLVWIPSTSVFLQLLNIAEFKTMDVIGDRAANVRGAVGMIQGSAVVPSREVSTVLNASGIDDGITTTQTVMIAAHRQALLIAEKRDITVEVVRLAPTDQYDLIAHRREGLDQILGTTQKNIGVIYNIDTAIV